MILRNNRRTAITVKYNVGPAIMIQRIGANAQVEIAGIQKASQVIFGQEDQMLRSLKRKLPKRRVVEMLELREVAGGPLV